VPVIVSGRFEDEGGAPNARPRRADGPGADHPERRRFQESGSCQSLRAMTCIRCPGLADRRSPLLTGVGRVYWHHMGQ